MWNIKQSKFISWDVISLFFKVNCDCSSTSCEGTLLRVFYNNWRSIHCPVGKINILTANYGRLTGGHICPGPVRTTNCGAAGALGKVRRSCQGYRHCALRPTTGQFGDPCFGTFKYLEVRTIQYPYYMKFARYVNFVNFAIGKLSQNSRSSQVQKQLNSRVNFEYVTLYLKIRFWNQLVGWNVPLFKSPFIL